MERREGERSSARQAKKVKMEHASDAQETTPAKPVAATPQKPPARQRKMATPPNAEPTPLTAAAAASSTSNPPSASGSSGNSRSISSRAPTNAPNPTPTPIPNSASQTTSQQEVPQSSTPTAAATLSSLERLVTIANQQRMDQGTNTNFRMDSNLLSTPTGNNLPFSLQRLQAMRNAQASPSSNAAAAPSNPTAAPQTGVDHLVDALGFSGVDLRAEEAFIQQNSFWEEANQAANAAIGSTRSARDLYLNVYPLSAMVHRVAKQYGLKVDPAALDYLSIATRIRFRNLLESMVRVSRHRAWSSHQRPPPLNEEGQAMYQEMLTSNPGKQLAAIEKAERIEEGNWRRMRLEREEADAAAQEAAANGEDPSGTPNALKRAKRPMGPSGRNLSEDVRKRLADSTAMRHLGANNVASRYSWLQSPGVRTTPRPAPRDNEETDLPSPQPDSPQVMAGQSLPRPRFAPQTPAPGTRMAPSQGHAGVWSDVATRQAAQREQERAAKARVTFRDALAALEREEAAGAGRGSGRRALYVARARGPRRKS
ncbi:hypothetical protein MYAM1_002443 [Malassezia yamatoensis]|uniref:Transcription initiation factor TFIID subunit 4 n=1 Tax=Malassezia yamatoensis TaxID=253288 RepID=A0AAJ5YUT4_9BASI|nr:hypothetical protein MYAM1_002443 [Malassezia yamatoensis]